MKKVFLKSYKMQPFVSLNGGSVWFDLTCEKVYLFGLLRKVVIIPFEVYNDQSISKHTDHWDEIIRIQQPLKL